MLKKTDEAALSPKEQIKKIATQVFALEIQALELASKGIGESFVRAVEVLSNCQGKVIVTGLGKSGIAGKKIAATLASTGKPALFLHAGEACHGDLGVAAAGDVLIALSYSGETIEVIELIPRLKFLGVPVIALTGKLSSSLARVSDVVINAEVPKYPWPFGLLPTTSNAVTVALGDALAIALLDLMGVREDDFAKFHPGGLLGKKLLMRVKDLMHGGSEIPKVKVETLMIDTLMEMTAKRLGVACVVDETDKLVGIITDGDIRRLFERDSNPLKLFAREVMTENPSSVADYTLAATALNTMENHSITALPVTDEDKVLTGIIHIHDILRLEMKQ